MWDKYENISDELLAAFLDGNTTREETELVLGAMSEDSDLMEVANITDNVISFEDKIAVWEGDYGFWELGIEPVLEPEEILSNTIEEDISLIHDDDIWTQEDDFDTNTDNEIDDIDSDSDTDDDSFFDY